MAVLQYRRFREQSEYRNELKDCTFIGRVRNTVHSRDAWDRGLPHQAIVAHGGDCDRRPHSG